MSKALTAEDLLPMDQYAAERSGHAKRMSALKADRRVTVGPDVTFYFESWDTMWFQVQEMLYIEKGGAEQIPGELEAYNPLIPNGRELIATMMIEIPDPGRRQKTLATLGGIEETISMTIGDQRINAIAEEDLDRTTADGKASSVQFVHFPFSDDQVRAFLVDGADVRLAIEHPNYRHMAGLPEVSRQALASDFDPAG